MPLNNAIPQIDDRRYDSLLQEVRTRIARYTPEWTPVWTDVNDSDPGGFDYFDWAGIAPSSYAQPALWIEVQLE